MIPTNKITLAKSKLKKKTHLIRCWKEIFDFFHEFLTEDLLHFIRGIIINNYRIFL